MVFTVKLFFQIFKRLRLKIFVYFKLDFQQANERSQFRFLAKIIFMISIGYQTHQPQTPIGKWFGDFVSYLDPFQPTVC
ncbi:MAG: hypothetical protein AMK69_21850 [Nitrospira bacterium SG8_3]|jgi:hypothetical protein|nr:MAG: hypothetical protein AMK69_21850 [Nitrospira bacterium SG8_3]